MFTSIKRNVHPENKRLMGHIANLSNKSHNKISFMEPKIKKSGQSMRIDSVKKILIFFFRYF